MKYDLLCLPGVPNGGCGTVYVSRSLNDNHERFDRFSIKCTRCGTYGLHEVRGRLEGLA